MKYFWSLVIFLSLSIPPVSAQPKPYMSLEPCTSTRESRQGSAAYDGIFFQFHNANDVVEIYDLKSKRKLQEIVQAPVKAQHCNTVAFGESRWDANDRFPLLYVSTERDRKILVYRILGDAGHLTLRVVQTIYLPESEAMGLYFPNSIVDGKGGYLWLNGYAKNSWHENVKGNALRHLQFKLPDVHAGDVTIGVKDALSEFSLPFTVATQGVVFHKGRICQAYGLGQMNNFVRIINPKNGRVEEVYSMGLAGIDEEPEGLFVMDGKLMVSTILGNIYPVESFAKFKRRK